MINISTNLMNNTLLKIIQSIHFLLILYIMFGPLYRNHLDNVIALLIFILFRWITNNHECTLTMIENRITGCNKGFISRIVNPIYKLRESSMNKILYFISITWLIILLIIKIEF